MGTPHDNIGNMSTNATQNLRDHSTISEVAGKYNKLRNYCRKIPPSKIVTSGKKNAKEERKSVMSGKEERKRIRIGTNERRTRNSKV